MIGLLIERCGVGVSLQDGGRVGWGRLGLPRSGALDTMALAAANALVGNPANTVALELLLGGAKVRVSGGRVRLALAGAHRSIHVDEADVGHHVSFLLSPGQLLTIGPAKTGMCAVLAVEGGFDVPMELGSRSLYQRAEVGGLFRRTLRDGDVLPVLRAASNAAQVKMQPLQVTSEAPLRVIAGPQIDAFTEDAVARFFDGEFRVTMESDRMGYRLTGPTIAAKRNGAMISDGVPEGAIQIPGSGQPIVLLADHQTTGGYPKIATVITPDLRLMAQMRADDRVRFHMVSIAEARQAFLAHCRDESRIRESIEPIAADMHARISLVCASIADSCVNAWDPETWEFPATGRLIAA